MRRTGAGPCQNDGWVAQRYPTGAGGHRATATRMNGSGGDGGESNSPSKTLRRRPLRACPMLCRRPPGRTSAPCRTVQSRVPRSGLTPDYATLIRIAAPLSDASTTREAEVASTLTLLPKQRGRESTGGCQVLRFAACLTRPDGTSARTLRQPSPVETTHPHRTERRFGLSDNRITRRPSGQEPSASVERPSDPGPSAGHGSGHPLLSLGTAEPS